MVLMVELVLMVEFVLRVELVEFVLPVLERSFFCFLDKIPPEPSGFNLQNLKDLVDLCHKFARRRAIF